MTTEDLIFDDTLIGDDGLTEKGLMALRAFFGSGYILAGIEGNDLVLYADFVHPNGDGDDIELGRINLYHVAGYSAQDLDDNQFNVLATLFRNIATLIEGEAIVDRHPGAEGFSLTTTSPQIFPRDDDEPEHDEGEE
jgi:hypothetical protein